MRIVVAASILLLVAVSVPLILRTPAAENAVPPVDLGAVVEEMGRDLTYEYDLITAEELSGCERQWEVELPYGVRTMHKLGEGNLLVASRNNLSQPGCEARYPTGEDEEILSIFGPDGRVLHRRSLGASAVGRCYTSGDGRVVSLSTGWDHDSRRMVIDHNGREYFSIEGGVTVELFPLSDGEYLVCSRPYADSGQVFVDAFTPTGERRPVVVGYFLREDGGRLIDAVPEEFNREWGQVIWADDEKLLYTWRVADASGVEYRYDNALALLDLRTRAVVWEKVVPSTSYQPAVASGRPGDRYILLDHRANDEGIRHTVIAAASGETVGKAAGVTGGSMWLPLGSGDGYFYANATGRLKLDRGFGFRSFLVKCSLQLHVVRHGLLYDGLSLNEIRELDGFVWGIHKACTLNGRCYPVVTAIYDMRGEGPAGEDVLSTRVKPVLLEGYWFIVEMTEGQVVLVGQIEPRGGPLQRVVVDRSWIDRERR